MLNATRACDLLGGLPAVNVLGVVGPLVGRLEITVESRVLDLSGPWRLAFDTMLPDADQVADPFHVVKRLRPAPRPSRVTSPVAPRRFPDRQTKR